MALTFNERAQLAGNPTFQARVRQAAVKYAMYISANPATTDANVRLLKSVLADPDRFAALFAVASAQNDFAGDGSANDCSVDSAQGDSALSSVIEGSVWPAFAREIT